ncbi:MAG: hypothetical protein K2M04_07795 [Muribaculaceae bacterium]|nr:hypothetical protein [Muribaculaceae bacterium]
MSILRYIGEFFLFRWIMGSGDRRHDSRPAPRPKDYPRYNSSSYHDYSSHRQSFDEFHEEQDDYDMFDDDF